MTHKTPEGKRKCEGCHPECNCVLGTEHSCGCHISKQDTPEEKIKWIDDSNPAEAMQEVMGTHPKQESGCCNNGNQGHLGACGMAVIPTKQDKPEWELAINLHDKYESLSQAHGWKTQKSCQTFFEELPEKNKQVMLGMARYVRSVIAQAVEEARKSW